jgi:hypothetical protein
MIDVLEMKKKAAIVGARLYFPQKNDGSWEIQHAGIKFNQDGEPKHIGRFQKDSLVSEIGTQEVEAVTGACMLVRKRFAEFDTSYIRGYYEDIDLCLKARLKGYKVYISHESKLIHYEGKSQDILKKRDSAKFNEVTLKNKALFHKRWDKKMKGLKPISEELDTVGVSSVKNIEIGGGENPLHPEYEQVDIRKLPKVKYNNDARALPFPSNSLNKIVSCYMLPCLNKHEAERALREWWRVLKPGGKLELHVPDIDKVMKMFISTQNEEILNEIYGSQDDELSSFAYGWSFQSLERLLSKVNFVRLGMLKNPKDKPYSLSVEVYKPK